MIEEEGNKKPEEIKKPEDRKDFLKEARDIAERNEKAVNEMRKLVERNEEIAAVNLLGGKTDAGIQPPKPIEETPAEYAKRIMKGQI